MLDKVFTNNQVTIAGEVVSEFTFSHEVYGEHFYIVNIAVCRLSNSYDVIPVMVSERLIDVTSDYRGCVLQVSGQFRSYNRHEENRNRLVLSVFAREAVLASQEDEDEQNPNHIFLDGYVCKHPVYRKTPLGREIADVLLAVNRPYGKSDYIPCICWGRNARFADKFEVGSHIQIWGRIQSREYQKKIAELFNTTLKISPSPEDRDKALNDIVRRVKEDSIEQQMNATNDILRWQDLIKEKANLAKLHISL